MVVFILWYAYDNNDIMTYECSRWFIVGIELLMGLWNPILGIALVLLRLLIFWVYIMLIQLMFLILYV